MPREVLIVREVDNFGKEVGRPRIISPKELEYHAMKGDKVKKIIV